MKNLCDFSNISEKLAKCSAHLRVSTYPGSRRRPGSFPVRFEIVLYVPKGDQVTVFFKIANIIRTSYKALRAAAGIIIVAHAMWNWFGRRGKSAVTA